MSISTVYSTCSAQHLRDSGFLCRRTYSLELTAWWSAWSNCELCRISAEPEDVPVRLTFEALAH